METLKAKAHIDENGILTLEVPTGLPPGQTARDVDVVLVLALDAAQDTALDAALDANGWPVGFFDRTYGALADDPIERPPQPPLEERDPIE